jgi:hypothetical protein
MIRIARNIGTAAALVLATTLAACARTTPHPVVEPARSEPLTIAVRNNALSDMDVYVLPESGAPRRIGTVPGNNSATFLVPRRDLPTGWMRVVAAPVLGFGRRIARSDLLSVNDAQSVNFTIEPNVRLSWAIAR